MSPPVRQLFASASQLHRTGDLHQAELLYRQVLAADPGHADALHRLGFLALQTGRPDMARDYLDRSIAIAPRVAETHNHLGMALQELGQPTAAEAAYRRAIELKRKATPPWLNLANLMAATGRATEAIETYRHVLAVEPRHQAAHLNIARLLASLGDTSGAEGHYQKALRLDPSDASAHTALAALLHRSGELNRAIVHYRTATELAPQSSVAFMNLALGMRDGANMRDAAHAAIRAHELAPGDFGCKSLFADCVKALDPDGADETIARYLTRALIESWDRPQQLLQPSLKLLRTDSGPCDLFGQEPASLGPAAEQWLQGGAFGRDAQMALLFAVLSTATVADYSAERVLTALRQHALQRVATGTVVAPRGLRLLCSLARQCFLNECAWAETAEESALVAQLLDRIRDALTGPDDIAPAWVAMVGCYRPLGTVADCDRLVGRSWPDEIKQLLTQQVVEPAAELALRETLTRLTPTRDATSEAVRAQYESNPYPRWVRTILDLPGGSVHDALRAALPDIALTGENPASPEILVAGCGTGQHPIETARRFANSRILAIDLSLSSLAYAQRKAREHRVGNIEFAPADILELGGLTRRFDIVESMGVLHHLRDPEAGWRILVALLRPGGFMKIGLYSALARAPIARARAAVAARGYGASPAEIRRFRQQAPDLLDTDARAALLASDDFYSVSGCRDLVFHVQEQSLSLPEIAAMIERLGLVFLGFELPPAIGPQGDAKRDLASWDAFEHRHPDTFRGMYQFWLQRRV